MFKGKLGFLAVTWVVILVGIAYPMPMPHPILLVLLGFGVGTFGTLVGAGGGFILMPVFFLIYPERSAEELTAISLAVVFLNALSGTIAYARKGRVDYRSGLIFVAASVPGAILGALTTGFLSRKVFDPIFAVLLMVVGIYLFLRPERGKKGGHDAPGTHSTYPVRTLTEKDGTTHTLSFSMRLGVGISAVVGYVSSFLGIGGGIIHVPAMVQLLNFPVHIATATSHFILAFMTLIATLVHLWNGSLKSGLQEVLFLGPGVVLGAQVGAKLSARVKGNSIVRGLALALVLVALRLLFGRH